MNRASQAVCILVNFVVHFLDKTTLLYSYKGLTFAQLGCNMVNACARVDQESYGETQALSAVCALS